MNSTLSPSESQLFLQVPRRLHHTIIHNMGKLKNLELNDTQVRTLMILKEYTSCTMLKLGKQVGMEKGSFTQVIDKLVTAEYVERFRDPSDRRSVCISLTDKGIKTTDTIATHINYEINKLFGHLSDDDITKTTEALKTIDTTIKLLEAKLNET